MARALIVIDVQNDYFPGGRMELHGAERAGEMVGEALRRCRAAGLRIFHIRHVARDPGASFFLSGTAGAEIHGLARPLDGEPVLVKHYPNGFRDTGLDELLRGEGIGELTLVGMMTHMCVDTTVRAAYDLGYRCQVVGEACATRDLSIGGAVVGAADVQTAFLAAIDGTFADVVGIGECLG